MPDQDPGPVPDGPAAEITSAIVWLPEIAESGFMGGPQVSGFPLHDRYGVVIYPAVVQSRPQHMSEGAPPLQGLRLGIDTIRRAFVVEVDSRKVWIAIDAAGAVLEIGRQAVGEAPRRCTGCGCTDAEACDGGCRWVQVDPPLCSSCT